MTEGAVPEGAATSAARRPPVRLLIALSVAAVLAVFLLYTSFKGGASPSLRPSQLSTHVGQDVSVAGIVVGPVEGDANDGGMRFALKDFDGGATVNVVYTGSVPDLFRVGRHVYMKGSQAQSGGMFVAETDSLVTKCPSKYAPKDEGQPA